MIADRGRAGAGCGERWHNDILITSTISMRGEVLDSDGCDLGGSVYEDMAQVAGQLRPLNGAKTLQGLSRYCRGTTAIRREEKQSRAGTQVSNSFFAVRGVEMRLRVSSMATGEGGLERNKACAGWLGWWRRAGVWRGGSRGVRSRAAAAMISQVKPNAVRTHAHTYMAPGARWTWAIPSHPSSNPLILGMSQSAGCEATGQSAPIREDGGI